METVRPDGAHSPAPEPPAAGECHLWQVPVQRRADWWELLTPGERRQAERFPAGHAMDAFVASRAVQRLIGSRYLGCRPRALRIDRDCGYCGAGHGRPRLAGAAIDYSVTHTGEWLGVAVVGRGRVGVDMEGPRPARNIEDLARVVLVPGERERFARVPAVERARWFLTAWTRKEAAMKATGLGLRAAPNQLDVSGSRLAVGAVPGWPECSIYLYRAPAPARHVAAVATTVPLTKISMQCGAELGPDPGGGNARASQRRRMAA